MLYVRGNKNDYDLWADMGAYGWSWDEVLPYFIKSEDNRDPTVASNGSLNLGSSLVLKQCLFRLSRRRRIAYRVQSTRLNTNFRIISRSW